uniref:Translation initiation factor eIF2B subunit epsilon n=1 Tax=Schistocephalus solidus TaxID=70667 RepID=A0A0V0J6X1_SCHSO
MAPKNKKDVRKGVSTATGVFKEDDVPPTAVIIAEDLASRFEPLSSHVPHCLLPLANVPLLHFPLSRLICDGFLNIIIYACRHADQISAFLEANNYAKRVPNLSVSVFNGAGSRCMGDVMRDLEANQLLRGVEEFAVVPADLVCDVNLGTLLARFKALRSSEMNNNVMNLVLADLPQFAPPDTERLQVVYSVPGRKLVQFVRHDRDVPITCSGDLFRPSMKASSLEIRSRLLDPKILLCSGHVPPLFQDNFDYDSMDDFVHGVLTNEEIMKYTIHLDFIRPDKVVLPAAPNLTHLLDITPRLLTRLGSAITQPPVYLCMDSLARLSEGLINHFTKVCHPPVAISPSCYVSRSARIHPTARLIGACAIGDNCHVEEDVCLINTCLGEDCSVRAGARLKNVVAVACVTIGQKVIADQTWICPQARILDGVRLGPKCFVGPPAAVPEELLDDPKMRGSGVGVCIGPNVTLPPECVLVPPGPNEVILPPEICGSKGWATYYQPCRNKLVISSDDEEISSSSDDESLDETEVVLWRTGWGPRTASRSRNTSRLYSGASEDALLSTQTEVARARMKSTCDEAEESEKEEGEVSDEFLVQEMSKTLQRSLHRQQPTEVIILEVNSLKHAYNISIDDLIFILVKALLDLAASQVKTKETTEPREQIKEIALNFKHVLIQFKEVLEKYLASSETGSQFCLQAVEDHACYNPVVLEASQWLIHALYDADLVSEETIQWWVKESPLLADEDLTEKTAALRVNIAPFLKWLEEAEEEEDEDENEEE